MMRSWFVACCSFVFSALGCLPAQSVQLADGRLLLAEVEPGSVNGEGLRVKRLDNGGVLDLRWDHLSAASALEWKKRFDLVGDSQEEIRVRADEVEFALNGGKQSLVGRIIERTSDTIVLQARGVPHKIPLRDLTAVRKIDAPVTQVMTKEEFYHEQLDTVQPGNDADKHLQLAETLMKVRNYERAKEHVELAGKFGNSKDPKRIETLLAKCQRFIDSEKELKLLDDLVAARSRGGLGDFEVGTKLIAQVDKDLSASKLKNEWEAEKGRFAEARKRFLKGQIADKWRDSIRVVATKAVTDASLTLQGARDYAQNKMTDDIVARLVTLLRLDANEIKQLWAGRKDTPIGKRSEHFGYGVGSWVLDKDAILKGTDMGKAIDKQKGTKDPQQKENDPNVDRLAKLLKQALERRRQAVQGSPEGQKEQTDEDWWKQAELAEKVSWLRAFYAEFGGQLVVTFASVSPCIACYGEGTVNEIDNSGKMVKNPCFLCHGKKWLRSFKAY